MAGFVVLTSDGYGIEICGAQLKPGSDFYPPYVHYLVSYRTAALQVEGRQGVTTTPSSHVFEMLSSVQEDGSA